MIFYGVEAILSNSLRANEWFQLILKLAEIKFINKRVAKTFYLQKFNIKIKNKKILK
jgi:hypothetical protein